MTDASLVAVAASLQQLTQLEVTCAGAAITPPAVQALTLAPPDVDVQVTCSAVT